MIYLDEAKVSTNGYVPYGWQFPDEDVFIPAAQGAGLNCLAMLERNNKCRFAVTRDNITSQFVFEELEQLSMNLEQITLVVLDNAPVHTAGLIESRRKVWERRGLYLFYLPRYSPHLNIVEILWRKLKYEWLAPMDYETKEGLFDAVRQALAAMGTELRIKFSRFGIV